MAFLITGIKLLFLQIPKYFYEMLLTQILFIHLLSVTPEFKVFTYISYLVDLVVGDSESERDSYLTSHSNPLDPESIFLIKYVI